MIIESFVLSMATGFVRKGSLRNLGWVPLRHLYLFLVPLALLGFVIAVTLVDENRTLLPYVKIVNIGQYVILASAVAFNLHIREMWMIGVGLLLNFAALTANGGVMPVSAAALRIAGLTELLSSQPVRHTIMTSETRLKLLADVIPVPAFSPVLSQVISIGDLLIAVAVFVLVQRYMCGRPGEVKECATGG